MLCIHCGQEIIEKKRTSQQARSMELWFTQIADEARNKGLTMDAIVKHPASLPITQSLLKDLFRLMGDTMYKRDSTTKLTRKEFKEVQEAFERVVAERLDVSIPFPSLQNNFLDE